MLKPLYTPENGELLLVDGTHFFMESAEHSAKELSNELLQPTGAVIEVDGVVVACGGNHARLPSFLQNLHQKGLCPRKLFGVKSGTRYELCPGCAAPEFHAEQRAIQDAENRGIDVRGGTMYLYGHWWACKPCWDRVLGAGVSTIYVRDDAQELFRPESPTNILGKRS